MNRPKAIVAVFIVLAGSPLTSESRGRRSRETDRGTKELSDEELETAVAEGGDTHVILVPVPKGFVSVSIFGAEVTPGIAIGALLLISALIKETGIPKEKLVQLGGCVNIDI